MRHTIDYIFVAKNDWYSKQKGSVILEYMDPTDVEKDGQLNKQWGNPCENHPSDHYSIAYKVSLDIGKNV